MSDERQYIATLRLTFFEADDVSANVTAELIRERASELIEEEDSLEVTQVLPFGLDAPIEPTELVNQMRHTCDMLIATRIRECYDLGRELHRMAWILEHRAEASGSDAGYDWGSFIERANNVLQTTKRKDADNAKG